MLLRSLLSGDLRSFLIALCLMLPAVVICLTVHECAHGLAARALCFVVTRLFSSRFAVAAGGSFLFARPPFKGGRAFCVPIKNHGRQKR